MARIDRVSYINMIGALKSEADNITENADKLRTLSYSCEAILGDEDVVLQQLVDQINESRKRYLEISRIAVEIARVMQKELELSIGGTEEDCSVWRDI